MGRGGVGITFLAQDRQCFNSQCVVKQLKPRSDHPKTLEVARRLFNREAEILNRLGHCDRIPRLLAYFEHEQDFFLVQELIEGADLSTEIIPNQPWSEAKVITLLQDILEVLLVVQQHGVIHRDLKPSNLMRRAKDGKIVLIDFGSVKQVSTQIVDTTGQVKPTVAVGTKTYMPMEQIMGRPGFYSDIYAVGVIIIQALTGVSPKQVPIDRDGELMWRTKLNKNINYNPRMLDIIDKMVRYRCQERYASASSVLEDLQQLNAPIGSNRTTVIVPRKNPVPIPETLITTKDLPSDLNFNHHRRQSSAENTTPKRSKLGLIATVISLSVSTAAAAWGIWHWRFQPISLALYTHDLQGFQISYPETWSTQNRDDFLAMGVIFLSQLEDEDDFQERVSVLVENLPNDMSLAQYTDESIAEIKRLSDPEVAEPRAVALGNNQGRRVVYRGEENAIPVKRMQTWSVQNNRAYVITYTAEPDIYDSYLPAVEKMLESFTIINN